MGASKKTTIGLFTIIGIFLFCIGIFYLGGSRLFKSQTESVLFFNSSVSGLSVGAPVVFRGVPLGNVTKIAMVFDPKSSEITIPVTIRIDENAIVRSSGKEIHDIYQKDIIRHMVQNGLGASLQLQSLVTGQYRIELNYYEKAKRVFRSKTPNNEIPTVPSTIDTLQQSLANLPLQDITTSLNKLLTGLAYAVGNGEEIKQTISNLQEAAKSLNTILNESPLRKSTDDLFKHFASTANTLDQELPKILASLKEALANLSQTTAALKQTSQSASQLFSQHSPTMQDLRTLLREAQATARSLHNLADMLNRNPEVLLTGKRGSR